MEWQRGRDWEKMRQIVMATSLLLLLLLVATAAVAAGGAFCRKGGGGGRCVQIETVRELDLGMYAGRWYEIGSTAAFKLLTEAGLRCNQALYTISPHDQSSLLLTNSGRRAISTAAAANVVAINLAVTAACASLRRTCTEAAELAAADIAKIQEVSGRISQGSASLPAAVLQIRSAVSDAKSRIRSDSAAAASLTAIGAAADALLVTARGGEGDGVSSVNGTIRPTSVPGKLQVSINGVVAPYSIIDLVVSGGRGRRSYSAALVYSCSTLVGGAVAESLFILSRRPQLEDAIVARFLSKARTAGILANEGCNDPFLLTLQNCAK